MLTHPFFKGFYKLYCRHPKQTSLLFLFFILLNWYPERKNKNKIGSCSQFKLVDSLSADDKCLIQTIKEKYLQPPPKGPINVKFSSSWDFDGQHGQPQEVDKLLKQKTNGFFIECGAFNGALYSNTLFFELKRNWTGLLIEASKDLYKEIIQKNRNTYTLNACASLVPHPTLVTFHSRNAFGQIVTNKTDRWQQRHQGELTKAQCFPIYSVIEALGNPTIDYFSLDIEGHEIDVLKTIPWKRVDVKVLTVEYTRGKGDSNSAAGKSKSEITSFMTKQGYQHVLTKLNDVYFIKS